MPNLPPRIIGILGAIGGASIWGIGPYFFRQLSAFDVDEIIAMRIIASSILFTIFLFHLKRLKELDIRAMAPRHILTIIICAFLVIGNWYVFVLAISIDRIIEAALGYYIYPLVAAFLGMVVLKERPEKRTLIALALAFIAVMVKASTLAAAPWIALTLAGTFGFYAVLRKRLPIAVDTGTALETLILLPIGLLYVSWQLSADISPVFGGGVYGVSMALLCGLFTTVPLLLFHTGNRYLPLAVGGLLFYINPTLQLIIGILVGEPFHASDLLVFGLIWTGLAIQFTPSKWLRLFR